MLLEQINTQDDDWNPNPECKDTILNKIVINFTDYSIQKFLDSQIKKNKLKHNNQIFDPKYVIKYAKEIQSILDEEDKSDNDDNDENDQYQSIQQKKLFQEQLINEQIYYDPLQDDINEKWIDTQIKTDGTVLSCPQCFIQLCYDSQRHEIYKQQYRALIVYNCKIDCNKVCKPIEDKKKRYNKNTNNNSSLLDIYFAVTCAQCQLHVANFEVQNKIYHFFNITPGMG